MSFGTSGRPRVDFGIAILALQNKIARIISGNIPISSTVNIVGQEITGTKFKLSDLNTAPISATDTGTLGEIRVTSDYIYVCTATNVWKRSALSTW